MKSKEDIILELKGKVIKLTEENNKLKKDKKELEIKYINLRSRYISQNNELLRLKAIGGENGERGVELEDGISEMDIWNHFCTAMSFRVMMAFKKTSLVGQ